MSDSAGVGIGAIIGAFVPIVFIIAVVLLVVAVVVRRTSRGPSLPAAVNMSGDGRYWWDGNAWQDAELTIPPHAPLSPDGAYWWDGRAWRPVPRKQ